MEGLTRIILTVMKTWGTHCVMDLEGKVFLVSAARLANECGRSKVLKTGSLLLVTALKHMNNCILKEG